VPSPLAHGLAGLAVHVLASRDRASLADRWRLGVTVGAALLPDLDLAFKYVDGRNHHNNELHSIGFALLAGATSAVAFRLMRWRSPLLAALAVFLGWSSHLVLDYLNVDTHPPIGLLALWPFSPAYWKSPVPLFLDIGRTLEWATLRHNVVAGVWECAVLVPVLLACWRYRSRQLGGLSWREASRASP
jgi:inner membrane protein